jgi:type IV pilus assembly protein PilC
MPRYFYTAKSREGETKSGFLAAEDTHQLAQMLKREGLVLIQALLEEEKEKGKKRFKIPISFFGGVPLTEKMMFTRNLQVMIAAGLPLPRALRILGDQSENPQFKKALHDIAENIIKGKSFSESIAKHLDIFSELFQSMVKVGEEGGTLEEVLKILTRQMEREHDLKSKIKGAMIYPAIIIVAMLGIGILMLITVIPKLAETFEELEIELPPTTKMVIFIGNFLANYWYLIPLIIVALLILFRIIMRTEKGKRIIDGLSIKIPIISSIIKKINSAYTVRTLGSLITSGVPIVRSLEVTSGALGNIYYKEALVGAAEKVRKGAKLSEVLKSHEDIYPLLVIQMLEVGEETGQTSDILTKLADFFEEEVTNATRNITAIIEPIIMLIIGAAVGFFAVSMVQPMYSMLGAIQ